MTNALDLMFLTEDFDVDGFEINVGGFGINVELRDEDRAQTRGSICLGQPLSRGLLSCVYNYLLRIACLKRQICEWVWLAGANGEGTVPPVRGDTI